MNRSILHWWTGVAMAVLWTASLLLPSVGSCQPDGTVHEVAAPGITWLILGWLGPFFGQFGWYANVWAIPMIFILLGGGRPTLVPSMLISSLALSSFLQVSDFNYLDDIGIDSLHLCGWRVGFFMWLGAMAAPLATVILERIVPEWLPK